MSERRGSKHKKKTMLLLLFVYEYKEERLNIYVKNESLVRCLSNNLFTINNYDIFPSFY